MDIKIIVAAHKEYWMPQDKMYVPIHVGAAGKKSLGYIGDHTRDNISSKNANYCELTGLYWAWRNLDADYLGIAHYRRHFCVANIFLDKRERVMSQVQMEALLSKANVVLPKPRRYYIESNYSQYVHAHHSEDLDCTRAIIQEKYPAYLKAYDASMKRTSGHRFNMYVMKREYSDAYCQWLFDILFELEKRLDISQYSKNDARVFGFVSERLLDVWLETNGISFVESPYVFMEKQNWIKKILNFLKRKVKGKSDE